MEPTISPLRWLQSLRNEYLAKFIQDGGAAVKFVVPFEDADRVELAHDLDEVGRRGDFVVAKVSSAETRVHMVDQIFFRIAEQVPWRELSRRVLDDLVGEVYGVPPAGEGSLAARIARANSVDEAMVRSNTDPLINREILQRQTLARDFRMAMMCLCQAELYGGPDGEAKVQVITEWLTGQNTAVSAVRPYQIFSRINRTNARYLLESLLRWIRIARYAGLIILLDTSRLTIAKNPRDGFNFYTKAMMVDAYEVQRQFIDSTDSMQGCLLIVLPDQDFLDVTPSSRGMGAYDALRLRVYDEVRDHRLVNPMGTLVRIARPGAVQ